MDGPERTPDLVILGSWKTIYLDTKEEKHCPQIKVERNSEMNCHQESGDTGPTLEQGAESKRRIPGKDMPDQSIPTDQGVGCSGQAAVMDPSQQAAVAGSVRNSTSLRKTSHRSIQQGLAGQEPHRANQPFISLQPPMASRVEHASETDAIEDGVSWINPRTGKAMKCKSQQTSRIWQLKPLCAILHPSTEEPQVSRDSKESEEGRSGENTFSSGKTKREERTGQESHSSNQEQDLQSGMGPSQLQSQHLRKAQEISQEPEDQKPQNRSEDGPTSQETPQPSQVRPTDGAGTNRAITWISKKTGSEMVSRNQQTSLVWERKPLSEILHPAIQQPQESRESKKGGSMRKVAFSEESRSGKITVLFSDLQPEASPSQLGGREQWRCQGAEEQKVWDSTKQRNGQGSPDVPKRSRSSQTDVAGVKRDHTWVSPRTGAEMKCKGQQTSSTWEMKALSEILQPAGQESQQKRGKVNGRGGMFDRNRSDVGSKVNREMTLSYTDGEEIEQTYSIISMERGILLNRKTRKILVNRGQQTVEALPSTTAQIAQDNYRRKGYQTLVVNEPETTVEESEGGGSASRGQQTISQWVHSDMHGQRAYQDSMESYETFVTNKHPSDEILFKIESSLVFVPVDEEDLLLIYGQEDSEKEGSFINNQTGKELESRCLQTEELFFHKPDLEAKALES